MLQFSTAMVSSAVLFVLAAAAASVDAGTLAPTLDGGAPTSAAPISPMPTGAASATGTPGEPTKAKLPEKVAEVLFTFDDGPAIDKTPELLDTLDRFGVKTIFFVNGWHFQGTNKAAERAREVMREAVRRGHLIGNHTVHHYFLCGKLYLKRADAEIDQNAELIEQAIGMRPLLFRTPYGSHCKEIQAVLARHGIDAIGWDIDPQDWRVKNTKKVVEYVEHHLKTLRGRAILLLHDVHATTIAAVPEILTWINDENQRRLHTGEPQIKVIDYRYLLPKVQLVPPALNSLGQVMLKWLAQPPANSGATR